MAFIFTKLYKDVPIYKWEKPVVRIELVDSMPFFSVTSVD